LHSRCTQIIIIIIIIIMLAPRQTLWTTPAEVVTAAIRAIPLRTTGDVVVDVGCGEGAVLLQWARELQIVPRRTTTTTTTTTTNEESNSSSSSSSGITSTSNVVRDVTFIGIDVEERRIEAARAAWESLRAELKASLQQQQQQQQPPPGRTTTNTATTVVTTTTTPPSPGLVPNITMTFICGNALECRPLWQPRATVLFVYLIPRGLRVLLPRPFVWPPLLDGDDDDNDDDNADESTTTTSATSSSASSSSTSRIRAIASFMNPIPSLDDLALPTTTTIATRATTTGPHQRRPRRRQTVSRVRLRIRVSDETMWPLYIYTVVDSAGVEVGADDDAEATDDDIDGAGATTTITGDDEYSTAAAPA
jgi:hypothetical protein